MNLLNTFLHGLEQFSLLPYLQGQQVVVAVSGGPDSLCLLHLLHRAAPALGLHLYVATLDHGLRGTAGAEDVAFVRQTAEAWGLPVHHARRDVAAIASRYGLGIEAAARLARYTFLAEVAGQRGAKAILTGHNADDQLETVLMHFLRGSGLRGLTGMQPAVPLSADHLLPDSRPPDGLMLLRPLLSMPREAITQYCTTQGLAPRQDQTNTDRTYRRNRLRHEVIPLLETINPNLRGTVQRMALILQDDYTNLEQLAEVALADCVLDQQPGRLTLDLARFREQADPSTQRRMLRYALPRLAPGLPDISFATLENALRVARTGSTGHRADLPGGLRLRVSYGQLHLEQAALPQPSDLPQLAAGQVIAVMIPGKTPLPDSDWVLHTEWRPAGTPITQQHAQPDTATLAVPPNARLTLRTRRPGDRFTPYGMDGHSQKLKKLLMTLKIPAEARTGLPLLVVNKRIAWVFSGSEGRIAEPFAVRAADQPVLLAQWKRASQQ